MSSETKYKSKIRRIKKTKFKKSKKYKKYKKSKNKKRFEKGYAPINISKSKYLFLIDKRQNKPQNMTKKENYQLDFALNRKYCNCIEKVKYNIRPKNKNKRTFLKKNKKSIINDNSPYGICTNSIYNRRGFKIPKKRTKCKDIYYK